MVKGLSSSQSGMRFKMEAILIQSTEYMATLLGLLVEWLAARRRNRVGEGLEGSITV
jgi:hypothetical protein